MMMCPGMSADGNVFVKCNVSNLHDATIELLSTPSRMERNLKTHLSRTVFRR
jgi:hypothetical protein